jgi:hypothetical protein
VDRSEIYGGQIFNKVPLIHTYNPDHVDREDGPPTGATYHRQFFNGVFSVGNEGNNSDIQFANLPNFLKKALENPAFCGHSTSSVDRIFELRRQLKSARDNLPIAEGSSDSPSTNSDSRLTRQQTEQQITEARVEVDRLVQQLDRKDCSRRLRLTKINVVIADMREDLLNNDTDYRGNYNHRALFYRPHAAIHVGAISHNEQTHLRVALGDSDFCEKIDPKNHRHYDFEANMGYLKSSENGGSGAGSGAGNGAAANNQASGSALVWDEAPYTHRRDLLQVASSDHNQLSFYTGSSNSGSKTVADQASVSWFAVHNAIPWGKLNLGISDRIETSTKY